MSLTLYSCLPPLRLHRLYWKLSSPSLIPAFNLISNYTVRGDCTFYHDSAHQTYYSNHQGWAVINYHDDGVIPSTPAGLTSSCAVNGHHIEPSTSIASTTEASALESSSGNLYVHYWIHRRISRLMQSKVEKNGIRLGALVAGRLLFTCCLGDSARVQEDATNARIRCNQHSRAISGNCLTDMEATPPRKILVHGIHS